MQHLTSDGKQLCSICGFPVRGKPHNASVSHMSCLMTSVKKAHKKLRDASVRTTSGNPPIVR
jgi:hypothetical protein